MLRPQIGVSALYLAVDAGYSKIVKVLLTAGANPNSTSTVRYAMAAVCSAGLSHVWLFIWQAGKSLLHICAEKGYARTAMMLIDASADIGALSPVRAARRTPPSPTLTPALLTPRPPSDTAGA